MKSDELVQRYPQVFHMADAGAWPGIKAHGLLSTEALLDLYGVSGDERERLLAAIRPESVTLSDPVLGPAVVRDNKPLNEKKLAVCLEDLDVPSFLRLLNGRVFFWLTPKRLEDLLGARAYRDRSHLVLTVDTAALVQRHQSSISLSPINSGSTAYDAKARGSTTFKSIEDYPYDERRRIRGPSGAIAELTVSHSVPDIADLLIGAEIRHPGGKREPLR